MRVLAELTLPFVRVGGVLVLAKGAAPEVPPPFPFHFLFLFLFLLLFLSVLFSSCSVFLRPSRINAVICC